MPKRNSQKGRLKSTRKAKRARTSPGIGQEETPELPAFEAEDLATVAAQAEYAGPRLAWSLRPGLTS